MTFFRRAIKCVLCVCESRLRTDDSFAKIFTLTRASSFCIYAHVFDPIHQMQTYVTTTISDHKTRHAISMAVNIPTFFGIHRERERTSKE